MTRLLDPLTFPLHGTRLIEASAGTGKTYTIAALYVRLVLGHGDADGFHRALIPPEILVVTFTNAATEELRHRIRRRLAQAAGFFRRQGQGDDYLGGLRDQFPENTWPGHARVLEQAAQWMDEAAIYTIHGWCQRMLRRHAVDSGSLFDLELDPDEQALLETAACDYWRSTFYPLSTEQLSEMIRLTGCDTPQALLGNVRPLLTVEATMSEDPRDLLDRRMQAVETARREWAADLDAAVALVHDAQADKTLNGNKYRAASLAAWTAELSAWVMDAGPLPGDQVRLKFSSRGLSEGVNKGRSIPEHPVFGVFDRLDALLADLKIDAAVFGHAARDISRRLRREKERCARMGFDDLLTRLHAALQAPGGQRLARAVREQFPVAFIDEFQDTDPVQYAIFSRVYLNRPETGLVMIGDPKQAIFAFRGADIRTYLKARQDTTADRRYTLGRNYRSSEGLVQSVNRLFAVAAAHPQGAFLFDDRIPFEPVDARGSSERFTVDGAAPESLYLWQLQQDGPISKTGEEGYLQRMAEAFAGEIVRLLNLARQQPPLAGFQEPGGPLRPLRPADIAILVRDGQEARAIRGALAKRRVRSVYLSDKDSVFHTPEAEEILHLLRACAEPGLDSMLRAALATPVLGLPLARLDLLNRDESAWETEVERFSHYRRIWRRRGVLPMLRALLHAFGVPARLLACPGGERSLTNLLHLAELLQIQANLLDGEQGLIRWLAGQIRQTSGGADEQILRLESDEALVRVITIHKSKGLEYPLVFCPFICGFRQVTRGSPRVITLHDGEGRVTIVPEPGDADLAAADDERLAEDLRLFYVAVTRARFACWLGIGVLGRTTKSGQSSLLHLSAPGYLLSGREMIPIEALRDRLVRLKGPCRHIAVAPLPPADTGIYMPGDQVERLSEALVFDGRVACDWSISSYSGLIAGAHLSAAGSGVTEERGTDVDAPHSAVEDQLQEVEAQPVPVPAFITGPPSIHRFPRGPQPGTFLHGLLEWAAAEGFGTLGADRGVLPEKIAQLCKGRGWDAWTDVLTDWMHRLLQTPLPMPDGQPALTLADLTPNNYQAEMEFLYAAHGVDVQSLDADVTAGTLNGAPRPRLQASRVNGMLKGFIDLVVCHQGRYYVMDYKSNYLGENRSAYGSDAMAAAIREHRYDLQYVLYTLALHRLLTARLPGYSYQRDVGGAVYLFLRGVDDQGRGLFVDKPPEGLIGHLDACFAGKETGHEL
jgi:exodeoxyribonuclease V beta subunit